MNSAANVVILRPNRQWVRIDWHAIWEYRDLLLLLVRRDFVSRYKQTILGPAWFFVQPLVMTTVFTVIFGHVAHIPTGGVPPTLFYLCGLLTWNYFSQNFTSTGDTFLSHANLFSKVYFPRLVVPLASVIGNLCALCIQLITFTGFYLFFKINGTNIHLHWSALLFPLLIVQVAALSLGVGLWMSSLTAKYRDLTHLSPVILQVWLYGTPLIYPLSQIPEKWRWLMQLNPMAMPVEVSKIMFLGTGEVTLQGILISLAITLFLVITGHMLFQRIERNFADSI